MCGLIYEGRYIVSKMYLHMLFMGTDLSAAIIFHIAVHTLHQTLSNLVALQYSIESKGSTRDVLSNESIWIWGTVSGTFDTNTYNMDLIIPFLWLGR